MLTAASGRTVAFTGHSKVWWDYAAQTITWTGSFMYRAPGLGAVYVETGKSVQGFTSFDVIFRVGHSDGPAEMQAVCDYLRGTS